MTDAAPETIASRLRVELLRLQKLEHFDELALRRLEREAEALKAVDLHAYYMVRGMIASVSFDGDGVRHNFRAALALGSASLDCLNYAVSLVVANEFEHATEVANSYEGQYLDDITFQKGMVNILVECAAMESAARWTRAWCETSTPNPLSDDPIARDGLRCKWGALSRDYSLLVASLRAFDRWSEKAGMPETELVRAAQVYRQWLREKGRRRPQVRWHATYLMADDYPTLVYQSVLYGLDAAHGSELEIEAIEHMMQHDLPAFDAALFSVGVKAKREAA